MKTAEELYRDNLVPIQFLTLTEFKKALTEHDNEIKAMIDEMLKEHEKKRTGSEDRLTRVSFEGGSLALTELKEKL